MSRAARSTVCRGPRAGFWFPHGVADQEMAGAHRTDGGMSHEYDDEVLAALPLAQRRTIADTADVLRRAGFDAVEVTPLREVLELDQRLGVAPGHEVTQQYLVTARRAQDGASA